MSKSHIKTFTTDPHTVELHELSEMTPKMTTVQLDALEESIRSLGQLNPVVMYQGKLVDGKHRLLTIKSVGLTSITYINLNSNLTLSEVEEIVLNGYEQRRHQTITQRAISAYKEHISNKSKGLDITQGRTADRYSVHTNDIALVKKLITLASQNVIDTLFDGGKIKLSNGKRTDNLRAIIKHFQVVSDDAVEDAFKTPANITDDEWSMIVEYTANIAENHASPVLIALANALLSKAKQ